ncbi:MAG: Imm1 family immunity protein [Nitrospirota bacterium]|nr:Imm1 family immunity protein [Nitrospirota bacterium]
MFADSWEGIEQSEIILLNLSREDIDAAIRKLNGGKYAIVTLQGQDEAYLAIGGGAHGRYIVYATFNNEKFFYLVPDDKAMGSALLFIGGQEGDFPMETIVDVDLLFKAVKIFVEIGELESDLQWKTSKMI